jgi:hypothetical protein
MTLTKNYFVLLSTNKNKLRGLVCQQLIPTERPPLVGVVSANLADRGCRVVRATNPHGRYFRFSRREPLLSFQVAPQLFSWGWVDPVSDRNRTRDLIICIQELWPLDHGGGLILVTRLVKLFLQFAVTRGLLIVFIAIPTGHHSGSSPYIHFHNDYF